MARAGLGECKHLWVSNESYDLLNTQNVPVMVFIEGDGVPWEAMNRIAFEPTPDEPLLLKWFLAANSPGVYLGRPCYFDLGDDACSAYWFTHGRYSEPVVTSLITVLKKKIHNRDIILVGHSGGAALAMLVAGHLKQVKAVVTIAGNLNVKAWVEHHRYSDLTGSLDPGAMPGLTCNIEQVHYYSSSDSVIQAKWLRAFSASQCNSSLIELPVKGHDQAWEEFQGLIMENLRSISTKLTQEK